MDTQLLESAKGGFLLGDPVDEVVLLIEIKSANLNHSSSKLDVVCKDLTQINLRGLVQRCPLPVKNLITFGSPHQVL